MHATLPVTKILPAQGRFSITIFGTSTRKYKALHANLSVTTVLPAQSRFCITGTRKCKALRANLPVIKVLLPAQRRSSIIISTRTGSCTALHAIQAVTSSKRLHAWSLRSLQYYLQYPDQEINAKALQANSALQVQPNIEAFVQSPNQSFLQAIIQER